MSRRIPPDRPRDESAPSPTHPQRAWAILQQRLQAYLAKQRGDATAEHLEFDIRVPEAQRANVETILDSYQPGGAGKSYRIGLIVQLAFGLTAEPGMQIDLTMRPPGARGKPSGVAHRVHLLLGAAHIVSVEDAYQNIAKNTTELTRGNFAEFDSFLRWATQPERTREELQAVFNYACMRIVASARPVSPLPELAQGVLTFARVVSLFYDMLDSPSGGANEQFIIACLLHAKVEQTNVPGHRTERMDTKTLTASDASSGAAADVQIKVGSRVLEAFEVTANQWIEKVSGARDRMRKHDLTRLHIIAAIDNWREMLEQMRGQDEDVSVLEIRAFIAALTAELTKASRLSALNRLYELLDRLQSEVGLVNAYVEGLRRHGLTA